MKELTQKQMFKKILENQVVLMQRLQNIEEKLESLEKSDLDLKNLYIELNKDFNFFLKELLEIKK